MDQSLGECGGLVGDEFVRLMRSHDLFILATIEDYRREIRETVIRPIVRKIVNYAAKEISDKPSHKLKGPQAAAQRQMQRINARKAMCEKAFGARS